MPNPILKDLNPSPEELKKICKTTCKRKRY